MNIEQIKTLLHHREPYLMVDYAKIKSREEIIAYKNHRGDEAHLQGHFPGAPILPGAMIQEICTQGAAILLTKHYSPVEDYNSATQKGHALGVLNKVEYAKYLQIVHVDQEVMAKIQLIDQQDNLFKFKSKVYQQDQLKAKLCFYLMNISDKYLSQ